HARVVHINVEFFLRDPGFQTLMQGWQVRNMEYRSPVLVSAFSRII
ncbi:uncharacterized protein METZ01_LOCUS141233, partial [marine metagenome]